MSQNSQKSSGCSIPPEMQGYIDIVETEAYPVCKEQKQLVALVRRVFENEDIYVDINQLARYMELQSFFMFTLYEWEKFVFTLHCCTYHSDTGEPRFPDLLLYVGRGAGKNGYLSFEDFCLLTVVNNIIGYNIEVCAVSENQAKTSFEEIRETVLEKNKAYMSQYFSWTKQVITNLTTRSSMKYRTNNAKSKDGLRSGKVDFDEYHQYENYDNINVFTGGLGKRKHPRRSYATTDGFIRGGPLDDIKAKAMAILDGGQDDNGLLPFMCRLDDESEADNPAMWVKANPSIPYSPTLKTQMLREWADCLENPSLLSAFMTKRMNVPIGDRDTEVTNWDCIVAANEPLPNLLGKSCIAGIDYARSNDFVAVGLLFHLGEKRYWLTHSFVCTQSADLPRVKAPLDEWAAKGLLTYVDDVEINPTVVTGWLESMAVSYNITAVAIDQYRYSLLSYSLEKIGFRAHDQPKNVMLVRPSDQQRAEPVINSVFLNHNIAWGVNPLMNWYVGNAKKTISAHGNFSYEKIEPKSRKTDGFMAFVSAMARDSELAGISVPPPVLETFVF